MNRLPIRIAAGLLALVILVLSVVPPGLRPVAASQNVEHLFVFIAFGVLFGLSFPSRYRLQVLVATAFAVMIEVIQMGAPGRHARVSDLLVDASGALIGLLAAAVLEHAVRRWQAN
jgi:VanZ family protein